MKNTTLILMTFFLLFSCNLKEKNSCTIKGEVIGYDDCKTFLLFQTHLDPTYLSEKIVLDENNSFEYVIADPQNVSYSLMCEEAFNNGTGYSVNFFTDSKYIEITIHPVDQMLENEISGSSLSQELLGFEKEEKKWLDTDPYGNFEKMDSVSNVFFSNKLKFVNENQNIVGYSILVQLIRVSEIVPNLNKNNLLQMAESFQKMFPDHPYSEYIEASKRIKVGNTCPDFLAPDRDGRNVILSEIIASNKIILLDLWAPWCGPCIEKGREIVPIYLKYKDLGFEILGVVGGIKDLESYKKAIDKEEYPWTNLYDINNESKIWEKFNIMNSGGATFLINKDRVILAINPTTEETERIIKEII